MLTIKFDRERSTKNTEVFRAVDDDAAVTTLYVTKTGVAKLGNPATLAVVIGTPEEFDA